MRSELECFWYFFFCFMGMCLKVIEKYLIEEWWNIEVSRGDNSS